MRRRCGSGKRQAGYVTVYSALVISLVLVPMLFFALDVASLMYYKAKAQNLADAAALTAVKDTQNWHIPVPDKFIEWVPYDGFFLNGLTLKNVKWSFDIFAVPASELDAPLKEKLLSLNRDRSWGKEDRLKLGPIQALPGNFPSPVIGVRAPVTAEVPVYTPGLSRALASSAKGTGAGKADTVTVTAEACAIAYYRPDYIYHRWWTAKTLDTLFDIPGTEPLKYYRAINCPDGAWDVVQLLETPLTEWFFTQYGEDEGQKKLDEFMNDYGALLGRRMKNEKEEHQGDPCSDDCRGMGVGGGTGRTWGECRQSLSTCQEQQEEDGKKAQEEKRKAEEEAKKAQNP